MNYTDVCNEWSFNEDGDLNLTSDYTQSISNRVKCPYDFLDIYYNEYGSDIYKLLGERFNKEEVKYYLDKALTQDKSITNYNILDIYYLKRNVYAEIQLEDYIITIILNEEEIEEL